MVQFPSIPGSASARVVDQQVGTGHALPVAPATHPAATHPAALADLSSGEVARQPNNFHAAVSALCYSLIRERCQRSDQTHARHNRVVRFVLGRHAHMQDFLRLPLKCLVLLFDWHPIFRYRRRFHRLDHTARWQHVQRWRNSRLSAMREFVRFFESLVVFGWYSAHDDV